MPSIFEECPMAKDEKKKTPLGKVGRVERERRYNRGITISTIFVVSAVIVVIIVGVVLEGFIRPNQSIATVMGEEILTKDFQARVRFERGQLVNQYFNIYQYLELFSSDPNTANQYLPYLQQIQFQLEPMSVGGNTLETMIEDIIIKNEAMARGIEISDGEINSYFESAFGYYPDGTPTPIATMDIAPTSTLSATQLALVTLTPTPTSIPTFTPDPEASPTSLPSPTIDLPTPTPEPYTYEDYQADIATYFDNIKSEYNVAEEDMRKIISTQILRQRLSDEITADLEPEEEQVWARHILVDDEETALNILDRLENGEDWAALALEFYKDTSNASRGGDLGWFNLSTMVPEFSQVAFDTPIGEISNPVETSFGWHLIQVLGHEMRPLNSNEYNQLKQTEFNNWLGEVRLTIEVEIQDFWVDRIPEDPSIPPQYLLQ
jgi:parvulin-like peptidyl-prolyl isomerase